jgi:hypothetical protein
VGINTTAPEAVTLMRRARPAISLSSASRVENQPLTSPVRRLETAS